MTTTVTTPGTTPVTTAAFEFACRIAQTEPERAAYFELRRAIFCREQSLFADDDRDSCDLAAYPIVCVAHRLGEEPRVVGVVRIWEESEGEWWGGRLGVHPGFRTEGAVGRRLVQTAVGIARGWGAERFHATVQQANVVFFRRLRWRSLSEVQLLGQLHHLMEASLAWYAPVVATRRPPGQAAQEGIRISSGSSGSADTALAAEENLSAA